MEQVISPSNIGDGVDPSEASLLLSTVAVALANCGRLGPNWLNCSSQIELFPWHQSVL